MQCYNVLIWNYWTVGKLFNCEWTTRKPNMYTYTTAHACMSNTSLVPRPRRTGLGTRLVEHKLSKSNCYTASYWLVLLPLQLQGKSLPSLEKGTALCLNCFQRPLMAVASYWERVKPFVSFCGSGLLWVATVNLYRGSFERGRLFSVLWCVGALASLKGRLPKRRSLR